LRAALGRAFGMIAEARPLSSLEWRPLPLSGKHEISEGGHIRKSKSQLVLRGKDNDGYRRYSLSINGTIQYRYGHVLVCETFNGPRPSPDHVAAHNDGDPLNNHYSNLRWATKSENAADTVRHGRGPKPRTFSDEIIASLIARIDAGEPLRLVSRDAGIGRSYLRRIRDGKARAPSGPAPFPSAPA
jgi:hypothetical protein